MSPLGHLIALVGVAALLGLCAATGAACLRCCALSPPRPLLLLPVAVLLGAGCLALTILAAGAAGGLQAPVLAALLLLTALAFRRDIAALPRLLRDAGRELMSLVPPPLLGLFAGVALLQLVLSLGPPADYDSLMYHVELPVEFLRAGGIHLPPDNLHVAQVGLAHMLYLPLIELAGYAAPAVLELAFAILVAMVIAVMVDEVAGRGAAALAFVTVWGTTAFTLTAQTPKIDTALVLYVVGAHSLLLLASPEGRPRAAVGLAGLLLGFAVGVKFSATLYAAALVPIVFAGAAGTRPGRERCGDVLLFGAAIIAGALPWLLKNGLMLGAPLYPMLSRALPPPWLSQAYGPLQPLEVSAPLAATALRRARTAVNLFDLLFAPGRLTSEAQGRMYFLNPLTLAAPFAIATIRTRRMLAFVVPPVLYLTGLLAYRSHLNLRYLIPALLPVAALGAAAAAIGLGKIRNSVRRRAALLIVSTAALLPTFLSLLWGLWVRDAPGYLLRTRSVADYLQAIDDYEITSHIQMAEWINANLAPASRVLMLFEGRGLYFRVPVLQDNVFTNWPFIAASPATSDCLERAGVTHVLVSESTLRYFTSRGLQPDELRLREFAAFRDRCLAPMHTDRDYTLYVVKSK